MVFRRKDIGNSNIHYRFYPFSTFLEHQRRLGFEKITLFGGTPHVWIDAYGATDGEKIKKEAEDQGLSINGFMPEFSSMRYTLGSEGGSEQKTWEYLRRCLDFTAKLECGSMIVTANGYLLDRTEEERDRRLKEALRRLGEMAGSYDIRLILLNQHEDATNRIRTIEDMKRAMEWADGVNVEVGVDTASVYEAGETLKEWLEAFGTRLTYVNLSNSKFDGGRYYWGDGYLNLRDILEALEEGAYAGAISCHYMIRDYLSKPWAADESSERMISWILEEGGGEHGE